MGSCQSLPQRHDGYFSSFPCIISLYSIKANKNSVVIRTISKIIHHLFLWIFMETQDSLGVENWLWHKSRDHMTSVAISNPFVRKNMCYHSEQTEGTSHLVANTRCFTKRNKPPIIHLISQYYTMGGNIFLTHLVSSFCPQAWRLIAGVILS